MDWNLGYTKIKKIKNKKPLPASHFFAFSDDKLMGFYRGPNKQIIVITCCSAHSKTCEKNHIHIQPCINLYKEYCYHGDT